MNTPITRAEHNEFAKRCDDEHRRLSRRIDQVENSTGQIQDLVVNVGKIAVNMEYMMKEQIEQGKRLEALEEIPNKGWNTLKNSIINAIGATIGGGIIAAIVYFISMKG